MVDNDSKVFLDRADQAVRILLVEVGVDATLARGAGLCDPHVARKGKYCCLVVGGVHSNHHDGVTALAVERPLAETAGIGGILGDACIVVGASDEEVLCLEVAGWKIDVAIALVDRINGDNISIVQFPVGVQEARTRHHRGKGQDEIANEKDTLLAAAMRTCDFR